VADSFGASANAESVEVWTEHLGGQFALVGLGNLRVERWGKGLVLRIEAFPVGAQLVINNVLLGALQRGLGKEVSLVGFEDEHSIAFLVLSEQSAERARGLVEQGHGLAGVIESLHKGAA
jgi:hypothetical protein